MASPEKYGDLYSLFHLHRSASADEIEAAYRNLTAGRQHVDPDNDEMATFILRSDLVYSVLSDPEKRREYDAQHPDAGTKISAPEDARPRQDVELPDNPNRTIYAAALLRALAGNGGGNYLRAEEELRREVQNVFRQCTHIRGWIPIGPRHVCRICGFLTRERTLQCSACMAALVCDECRENHLMGAVLAPDAPSALDRPPAAAANPASAPVAARPAAAPAAAPAPVSAPAPARARDPPQSQSQ
ncbi:hypothetical protein F4809DRAFT_657648 [Biscogniauxia mediterranea]|nr:hypothetical protein F4809DRAFT_657648 [Biscogniauxia mediterranea]